MESALEPRSSFGPSQQCFGQAAALSAMMAGDQDSEGAPSPSFFSEVGCLPLPLCYPSVAGGKGEAAWNKALEPGRNTAGPREWAPAILSGRKSSERLSNSSDPNTWQQCPGHEVRQGTGGLGSSFHPTAPQKNRARRKAGSRRGGLLPSLLSRGRPLSPCWREEPPAGRAPSHIGHLIPQLCIFLLLFVIVLL